MVYSLSIGSTDLSGMKYDVRRGGLWKVLITTLIVSFIVVPVISFRLTKQAKSISWLPSGMRKTSVNIIWPWAMTMLLDPVPFIAMGVNPIHCSSTALPAKSGNAPWAKRLNTALSVVNILAVCSVTVKKRRSFYPI